MYDVKMSVLDSSGLIVDPQTQELGNINEGGIKTAVFSVQADEDETVAEYPITIEVAYADLRGITHTETFQSDVNVTSNVIKENLDMILIIVAIIVVVVVLGVYFERKRRISHRIDQLAGRQKHYEMVEREKKEES